MPAAVVKHVFQPFAQGDQGIARSKGGLGLGLSITRGLVRLHGGEVTATSVQDEGASFEMRLPLLAEERT
jgi:signal transduction histidine kinase